MTDSRQLLRDYAERVDEQSFGELVRRHLNFVYTTALRLVEGDASLAQEITQTVFTDLARKAKAFPADVVVGGWLYQHTCFTAAKARRAERRRHIREREAVTMQVLNDENDAVWEQVAPVLDEAMNRLSHRDRNAIILRFFEKQSLRAVGEALGASEDAARMRVERALETLRKILTRRGVALSGAVLASALAGQAVMAAPAALAVNLPGLALAGVAAATGNSLTLLKVMTFTKFKVAIVSSVVLAGLVTPLVLQHQSLLQLRDENTILRQSSRQLNRLGAEHERLAKLKLDAAVIAGRFAWRQLESTNYFEYINNLKKVDCPWVTICDLIIAEVDRLYAGKIAALQRSAKVKPYWSSLRQLCSCGELFF
ncbi:MAG: RNA polymerase sigma factor [Limisphaerales bacterium]